MELLRPENINYNNAFIASISSDFEYTDPIFNVKIQKRITTVNIVTNGTVVQFPNNPSEDQIINFAGMQSLMKCCVDNAEHIKDQLLSLLQKIMPPSNEEERIQQMKMDFMSLKKWFMDDIRSSKIYKKFTKYNSTKKLKPFSKIFNDFILDRNIYTHGQLCFKYPEYNFIIDYIKTPEQIQQYAYVKIEIIESYNLNYREIKEVISEYQIIHQESK